ncbi:MAG TPA: hypothetical protein VM943_10795 [Pyrinomonadaceae bacterium]|nr:hypothetical protein [Pyrinomonadaceae bacterium]
MGVASGEAQVGEIIRMMAAVRLIINWQIETLANDVSSYAPSQL